MQTQVVIPSIYPQKTIKDLSPGDVFAFTLDGSGILNMVINDAGVGSVVKEHSDSVRPVINLTTGVAFFALIDTRIFIVESPKLTGTVSLT